MNTIHSAQTSNLAEPIPLESVLFTEELDSRPTRAPDYERENRALIELAKALAESPQTILQTLVETILDVFQTGSAGISLLTEDGKRFVWPAIAGQWKPHIGGGSPRDFGPCGDVLNRNSPQLFRHFEQRYTYFQPLTPPIMECLHVPIFVSDQAIGTIWVISHDDLQKFDNEDVRMLVSLGVFASAAFRAEEQSQSSKAQIRERQKATRTMQEMNEALLVSSVRQHELADRAVQAEAVASRLAAIVTYSEDAIISKSLDGIITSWNKGAEHLFGYKAEEVIGQPVSILIPQEQLDEEPRILDLIRKGQVTENYETLRKRRDGSILNISLTVSPLRDAHGTVIGASKIARDITVRKQAEALLVAQKDILDTAATSGAIDEVLQLVVNAARRRFGYDSRSSLFLLEPDGLHLRFAVSAGLSMEYISAIDHFEIGPNSASCGNAAFTGQLVVVADVTQEPSWAPFLELAKLHDIRAVWSQPLLTVGGKVLGTLALYHRVPRGLVSGDLDAIQLLSQTAALVIDRKQVEEALTAARQATVDLELARSEEQRHQSILQERNRMAQEIHDTLAQGFTGILFHLEAAKYATTQEQVQGHIGEVRSLARQSLLEARRSVQALRPLALEGEKLPGALKYLIRQTTSTVEAKVNFAIIGSPYPLSPDVEDQLFRICQEALTNALKHAKASQIEVELVFEPSLVRLSVKDNGIGFDAQRGFERTGYGLIGIYERAEQIDGQITLVTQPGQGTHISVTKSMPPIQESED